MDQTRPIPGSFSRWRRWAIAANVVLSAVALLAVIAMVNYLASRHFWRFEGFREAQDQLSPLTRQFLPTLTNDVKVTVVFDPEESALYGDVKSMLVEYQLVCPRLQLEYVNYGRNPARADILKNKYHLPSGADTLLVIFDCAGRYQIVRERELSEYDVSGALEGTDVKRIGFRGEQFFTSALVAVSDPRPVKAYYLVGHGEPELTEEDSSAGYRRFSEVLGEKHIELQPLSLHTNEIPDDCQLVVVAGPRSPIPPAEQEKLNRYLKNGGRAFILLYSPLRLEGRRSGLERLLAEWNVDVGNNVVIDRAQSKADTPQVLLASRFGAHPIVRPLHGSRLAFVMPCSVRPRDGASRAGETIKVEELASTSPEGMAVAAVQGGRGTAETNGIISLAVAVEKGAIADVRPDRGATRLVVVGEATFLSNAFLDTMSGEANRDFASLTVNWLLDRVDLLNISPRPLHEYRIIMTKAQLHGAAWVLLGAMPGSVLVLGLLVWLRRRK